VGSIGAFNGDGYIGNGDVGFSFADGGDSILPVNTSTPAYRTDAISLGNSSYRYKDLYLSGGVYLGGTITANLLDDYEEGLWTPTATNGVTLTITTTSNQKYVKIGQFVMLTFDFTVNSTSNTSIFNLTSFPFTGTRYNSGLVNWTDLAASAPHLHVYDTAGGMADFGANNGDGNTFYTNAQLSGHRFIGTIWYHTSA